MAKNFSIRPRVSRRRIAPVEVGKYVHRAIAGSELVLLDATGHCPNLSAPDQVIAAIRAFV